MDFEALIRPHLRHLKPYTSARDDYKGQALVWLDANENALGSVLDADWHRYPDPHQVALKEKIAEMKGLSADQIFLGNGSDEAIDLLYRAFCEPGKDKVLLMPPTYGMYGVSAAINDVGILEVPLTSDFQIATDQVLASLDEHVKLVFICSPNNPSGNLLDRASIFAILDQAKGLVVVDEAYIDFADTPSMTTFLDKYPNLVVLQTFSKAWGLAALRLGMAYAHRQVIHFLDRIKPPYNVNGLTQKKALETLSHTERHQKMVEELIAHRNDLQAELEKISGVEKIHPSDANFLLVKFADAERLYQALIARGIVVRDRSRQLHCDGCLRITVGTKAENERLVAALREELI